MKKIEMLLFLILIVFFASSQSIVDTTKRWNNYIQFPSSYPVEERTELVLFSQDTMIDSKIYKKVLRTTDELMINWEEYCYIRETIDKKVYIRSDTSSQEYLLYDMDVNINDTLPTSNIINSDATICSGQFADIKIDFTGTAPWTFTYTIDGLNPVKFLTRQNKMAHHYKCVPLLL